MQWENTEIFLISFLQNGKSGLGGWLFPPYPLEHSKLLTYSSELKQSIRSGALGCGSEA